MTGQIRALLTNDLSLHSLTNFYARKSYVAAASWQVKMSHHQTLLIYWFADAIFLCIKNTLAIKPLANQYGRLMLDKRKLNIFFHCIFLNKQVSSMHYLSHHFIASVGGAAPHGQGSTTAEPTICCWIGHMLPLKNSKASLCKHYQLLQEGDFQLWHVPPDICTNIIQCQKLAVNQNWNNRRKTDKTIHGYLASTKHFRFLKLFCLHIILDVFLSTKSAPV